MGLCVFYDRVLELTKEFADSLVKGCNIYGVFCPKILKTGVFTIIAKDNIDHNARSITATKHYHGTSMTAMQFIAEDNRGEDQIPLTEDQQKVVNPSKKVLQTPSSYTQPETFYLKKVSFKASIHDHIFYDHISYFNDHKHYDRVRAQNSALQESWMVDYLLS